MYLISVLRSIAIYIDSGIKLMTVDKIKVAVPAVRAPAEYSYFSLNVLPAFGILSVTPPYKLHCVCIIDLPVILL